ncbi:succinic semialdehyde dehydrogenase [Allokutzneria albata]|uniref:Succinate-semialdehyde dehydrogenase / glutarate-semialdehyde dehydrogenase n=1 Tax=Allokutzneria albata TaxID=211114 RepID=A0A1G9XTK0_ALLAB|nr:succinic semialdehyde dehydrogenase [Allokutzneria albata]SDM99583.1 succinate-semialdehyde dehydrogenase / glutarate-semialdehyde dehydrogenase [Allokutzneria albata]
MIDKNIVLSSSGTTTSVVTPLTGSHYAALPVSTVDDVAEAYARAAAAQREWCAVAPRERGQVLLRFHDLLLSRQAEALDIIQTATGKARWHAFEELAGTAVGARYYGRRAERMLACTRRSGFLPGVIRVDEVRRPKGVVGVISPWNYPLELGVSDGLAAVAAGNGVVHKPDVQGALTALWGVGLLREAGMPEDLWQVVVGDGPTIGGAVVDGADHVCFTGSTRTGREVAKRAAERLVGVSLELGGKNALLVLDDANPDRAAEIAVRACFTSAGQLCVSTERLYVHDAVHDAFMECFLRRVRHMRLGVGLDWSAEMGSLASQRQLGVVEEHVRDAVEKGARVLTGGKRRPDVGPYCYEPTVLAGVTEDMTCFAEETFGPVVSVYRCSTVDEAVHMANDTRYGLNASVLSGNVRSGRVVAARLNSGSVNVNEGYASSYGSVDAPMGGIGDSGIGRRHGAEGLLRFTEAQTIASRRGIGLGRPPLVGFRSLARGYTLLLKLFRALGRS